MPALILTPTYPAPKREVQIVVSPSESGTNFARFWVTAAPQGSPERAELDRAAQLTSASPRVEWKTGQMGAGAQALRHTFETGGRYTFKVQEYTLGTTFGGGYQYSPDGAQSETKVGSEYDLSIDIGQRMTQQIGAPPDTATLVVWVWASAIRLTSVGVHGEATPAVIAPASRRAAVAAENSTLKTHLLTMADMAVSTALGTPVNVYRNVVSEFNDHVVLTATQHANSHAAVELKAMYETATQVDAAAVSALLRGIYLHLTNDANDPTGTGSGPGTASIHNVGGNAVVDTLNLPLMQAVTPSNLFPGIAEAWRCVTAHHASTAAHTAADATNVPTTLPALFGAHRYFLAALALTSPVTPPGQSAGATLLAQLAGFTETPI